jgi:hypothetical protein
MTKNEVRIAVKNSILNGKTKQETFEGLRDTSKISAKDLANIIRNTPTIKAREHYKTLHIVLKVILLFTILIKLRMGILIIIEGEIQDIFQIILVLFVISIINILLLIGVSRYRPNSFKLVAIFTIIGLYQYMQSGIVFEEEGALIFMDLGIHVGFFLLGLHLHSKFFPKYLTIKEPYQNSQGENEFRQVINFED